MAKTTKAAAPKAAAKPKTSDKEAKTPAVKAPKATAAKATAKPAVGKAEKAPKAAAKTPATKTATAKAAKPAAEKAAKPAAVKAEKAEKPAAKSAAKATAPKAEAKPVVKKAEKADAAPAKPAAKEVPAKPAAPAAKTAKEETTHTAAETKTAPATAPPAEKSVEKPAKAKKSAGDANADFDWASFEGDTGLYNEDKGKIAEKYDKTLSNVQVGEVVEGTVIGVGKREVVVNIGYKSEGIIPVSEFRYNPELAVGEKVEVYVESAEDKRGQLLLSHKKARQLRSWDRVNEAMEKDEIIKGYIKCRTKGGMIVDVFGIEAFLPGSQIDVKPIRDYDVYVDKTMEFKVVKINQEFRNVVVSHKALIEAELETQKKEIMSKLEKGQILEGTVKNITSYGVFIDLGGVDGLVHITDLSWGRVNHPEEVVQLDQKLNVVILDFDDTKKRIALGLKQLTPHPWSALNPDLKVGDKIKGKVVVLADYGAFVEVAPGVEGLVHVSEMSWSQHLRSAQDFLKVGQEIEAVILTLDREARKMSLGIKQLTPDPWENIETKYPVGSRHTAKVRNFTNFGVFVEIAEGIDGLIHISDLSWTKKIKHPAEFTQIGADIDVIVLEIDKENRRLSLGHKQTEENPWDEFEGKYGVETIHEGTVTEINDKGAVVTLGDGIEGFAPSRQLAKEDGSQVKVGDKLPFKVIEFSKATRRITLSHVRTYDDSRREEPAREKKGGAAASQADSAKSAVKKINASVEKTTLGDVTGLAEIKAKMEKSEAKAKKASAEKAHAEKAAAEKPAGKAEE